MAESKKDRIARQVADLRVAFDLALSDKRKYPAREFNGFLEKCAPLYRDRRWGLDDTQSVAQAVNGLREFLQVERKRIPGNVLFEADRLHILASKAALCCVSCWWRQHKPLRVSIQSGAASFSTLRCVVNGKWCGVNQRYPD
jgi:hypothetical protein